MLAQRRSTRKSISVLASPSIHDFSPIVKRKSIAPAGNSISKNSFTTPKKPTESTTPVQAKTPASITSVTRPPSSEPILKTRVDTIMARLQRDRNSPSATARMRANQALKDSNLREKLYGQFDVHHEMQDLITEEERKPYKPKTIVEVFSKCKFYVEVRTGDDNRSAGIKNRLLRDGIVVNEKLYKDTTHVIFKDGLLSTYKNAQKLGIPVTNILWIDACVNQRRLVDPEKFKISNLDRYERPELYKKIRRQKSIQPNLSMLIATPTKMSFAQNDSQDNFKHYEFETIEETSSNDEGMELTLKNDNYICGTPKSMDVDLNNGSKGKMKKDLRRITTFTPHPMEQTGIAAKLSLSRRNTLFTPQLPSPTTPDGSEEIAKINPFVFNSGNKIAKSTRRSVYDISMNILDLNCKAMSEKKNYDSFSPAKEDKQSSYSSDLEILETQLPKVGVPKKRKLFTCDFDQTEDFKENLDKSVQIPEKKKMKVLIDQTASWKTPQMEKKVQDKVDRRRTLAFFKTEKPKDVSSKAKTPMKPIAPLQKIIVCTNMSATDKKIIQAAIIKLGGRVEAEVTTKTTHVVSPNDDRTMNILRGVIRACIILTPDWIHDSVKQSKWLEITPYRRSICDSNRVFERSLLGTKNYKNTTFAHSGLFFLNQESIDNIKRIEYLKEIITLCGGAITENKAEAKVILSDAPTSTSNGKQIVVLPTFIFDSAMKGISLDSTRYAPKAPKA